MAVGLPIKVPESSGAVPKKGTPMEGPPIAPDESVLSIRVCVPERKPPSLPKASQRPPSGYRATAASTTPEVFSVRIGLYGRVARDQARSDNPCCRVRECRAEHDPSLHPNGMRVFGLDAEKAMEVVPGIAFPTCSSDVFSDAQARRYSGGNFTLEEWDYKGGCRRVVNCGWTCGHQPRVTPAYAAIKSDILRLGCSGKKARYAGEDQREY